MVLKNINPINQIISGYKVIGYLGAGGMGEVYKAVHLQLGRKVAIKILHQTGMDARFKNEAQVQSSLRHDHIASMYEYLEWEGRPCIIMEYVSGINMEDLIRKQGGLSPEQAFEYFLQILGAIKYLHKKGIIHRDIKPGNIKIQPDNKAKLLDFGVAKGDFSPKLTMVGFTVGSLEYMAPEQLEGFPGKPSDIWSLGVLLYEMISGTTPFAAKSTGEIQQKIRKARYSPLLVHYPEDKNNINHIISLCLKTNPVKRISASNLLEKISRGGPIRFDYKKAGEYFNTFSVRAQKQIRDFQDFAKPYLRQLLTGTAIVLLLVAIILIITIDKKDNHNPPPEEVTYDSVSINVMNAAEAKIIMNNKEVFPLPYVIKGTEGETVDFSLNASGYLEKKVSIQISKRRQSNQYVLEKEK